MSFFEDDEPTTVQRAPRPRRSTPPRRPSGGGGGRGPGDVDAQTLRNRRIVAIGGGLVAIIILVLLFNACQSSRAKNALRDYNQAVGDLVSRSDTQVGQPLFEALAQGSSQSPEDLQQTINQLRSVAREELQEGKGLSTPGDVTGAQQALLTALELREDGLQYIAARVTAALGNEGDQADQAISQIAGQMQAFLASDVLIRSRVTPVIRTALTDKDVAADPAATQGFLPNYDWLQVSFVADQLGTRFTGGNAGGGGGGQQQQEEERDPDGLYGTSLDGTSFGDTTLAPDPESNRVPIADGRTISVQFTNGGEADESDIPVSVELQGSGRPIEGRTSVDSVAQGETATATIRLPTAPSTGEVYTVSVDVGAVPGEDNEDNNQSSYNVLFE